jgi:MarR-like DNA-binding transcriptional regulator SgrR of sgrS sRNA
MFMDHHLLNFWRNNVSGTLKQEEIANILGLSLKQTSRYLNKWSDEGWLTYSSGRGRGNLSKLKWKRNVDEAYEKQMMVMMETESVETCSKYLLLDWSKDSKLRLFKKFQTRFGYSQNALAQDKLVIPRKQTFQTVHPLEATDVYSAHLIWNVFNRLVALDANSVISSELAHSWEVTNTKLRLFLKKDVKFHDGSILTAEDVVQCLQNLTVHPYYRELWRPINKIEAIGPLVIDICFPNGCSYPLHILATTNSSIYKEHNGQLHGTGSFYIEENNESKTTLVAFRDYFQERPLLDVIEFVQVPEDFETVYRTSTLQNENENIQVESDSGFGVVIMNISKNRPMHEKEVRDYVHSIIGSNRHLIHTVDTSAYPNEKGFLSTGEEKHQLPNAVCPKLDKPLILKVVGRTEKKAIWLKELFEKSGLPVELKKEHSSKNDQDYDMFIHCEIYELNEDFSFLYFLKNGYSPLAPIVKSDEKLAAILEEYVHTPFDAWRAIHQKVETYLIKSSIMIPLYYEKRQVPFSADLMNINIKHFGFADFSKLWVLPEMIKKEV